MVIDQVIGKLAVLSIILNPKFAMKFLVRLNVPLAPPINMRFLFIIVEFVSTVYITGFVANANIGDITNLLYK